MKKMKVIIDAQKAIGHDDYFTATNGVAQYTLNLITKLLERNRFDYRLAFFDYKGENRNKEYAEKRFSTKTKFLECREIPYPQIRKGTIKAYDGFFTETADIYWFPYSKDIPIKLNYPAVATVYDLCRLYMDFNDAFGMNRQEQEQRNSIKSLKSLNAIIAAVSNRTKREIMAQDIINKDRINVVYGSCNEELMYPDNNKRDLKTLGIDGEYMLSIGRFEGKKNQVNIIRAFNVVAKRHPKIKLVFTGRSTISQGRENVYTQIMGQIKSSPHKERIIIIGACSEDQKRVLLSNAYALIYPSMHEGFGLPILEAMRCGCPVITSNITACPEVAGDAGLLVSPSDALDIAEAMEIVLSSDKQREKMRIRGFKQAAKFSWEKTAEQMENLFVKAANKQ